MGLELIYLFAGVLLGGAIGWFMAKNKGDSADLNTYKAQSEERFSQITELKSKLDKEEVENDVLQKELATVEANFRNLEEKLRTQKEELEELQKKFSMEFQNLANKIFEEKSQKFTEQNKSNIGEILNPLKEKIEKFEEKVEKTGKESQLSNTALKEQILQLKELNMQMSKEAESLTRALKGDSKAQGNWGEMQLEAILQKVGLEKNVHYEKERNLKNEDGSNQRLDYIIKLPDDKYLILDSKVSLTAYSNYFQAEDDLEKERHLKNHINSIKAHIKMLSEKQYQNLYDINQPDYVMMFVANEPALTMALREDQDLYEKALDKNIVLVSTTTLMATLRTISYIWKQDLQNKNALEIARQAGNMYDKFVGFVDDLTTVGTNMDRAKNSYEEAMKKLFEGKGNLVKRAEDLKSLGAKTNKQLDNRIVDRISEES